MTEKQQLVRNAINEGATFFHNVHKNDEDALQKGMPSCLAVVNNADTKQLGEFIAKTSTIIRNSNKRSPTPAALHLVHALHQAEENAEGLNARNTAMQRNKQRKLQHRLSVPPSQFCGKYMQQGRSFSAALTPKHVDATKCPRCEHYYLNMEHTAEKQAMIRNEAKARFNERKSNAISVVRFHEPKVNLMCCCFSIHCHNQPDGGVCESCRTLHTVGAW